MFNNKNIIVKNILLTIFSFFIIIFIIEIILRLFSPQPLKGSWLKQDKTGLYINKNSGTSIDESKYSKRVKYYFDIFYNRKTQTKVFKNDARILVLGDSFTFGYLLPEGSTYIDKLQNKFLDYQFINSAVIGWGSEDYFKFIENYCSFIKPKYILIFLNHQDFVRSNQDRFYTIDDKDIVLSKNYKINEFNSFLKNIIFLEEILENSHFISLIRQSLTNIYYSNYLPIKKIIKNKLNNDLTNFYNNKQLVDNKLSINTLNNYDHKYDFDYRTFNKIKKVIIYSNDIVNSCHSRLIIINLGLNKEKKLTTEIDVLKSENFFNINNIKFYDLSNNENIIYYVNNIHNLTIKFDGHPNEEGADYIYRALIDVVKDVIEIP
jgi:hypothetical protein